MSDGTETEIPMSTATGTEAEGAEGAATGEGEQKQETTFTQAQVDAIVRDRLKQQAANKFGDYDDLKAAAEGAQTLEQRLADVEGELSTTKAAALRTRIAAEFGVSTKPGKDGEPSDADLFLTATDEATLTAQAQRLAGREAGRKTQGNVAPKEGTTTTIGTVDPAMREFASQLFAKAD